MKALVLSFVFFTALSLPGIVKGQSDPTFTYVKVTSIPPDDWTGTYLICNSEASVIFETKTGQYNYVSVEGLSQDKSTITHDFSDYEIEIAKYNASSYSLYNKKKNIYVGLNTTSSQEFNFSGKPSSIYYQYYYHTTYKHLRTNASSSRGIRYGNSRFAMFNINQYANTIAYYKKIPAINITGAGDANEGNGRYYLIASPIDGFEPTEANGFLRADGKYDLYYFDESTDLEWRNYKDPANSFTSFASGKGYLYANHDDVQLVFNGTVHGGGTLEIPLKYTEGQRLAGWNLIGNPFDVTAYFSSNRDFYKMNTEGTELIAVTTASQKRINAMEGVFVQATDAGQSVTLTTALPGYVKSADAWLDLNVVNGNDNVIDRATIRFGEGETLSKLMINENNTKIYIPKEDGDYAVARSNGQKNIPVNFKASKMGRYTISVETEGLNLNYLHLIDRLTEEDIDILKENKYSFIASTSDNEARFVLAFSANGDDDVYETFAYQSGSDIIVRGEGELQIFDVMGRMVATHHVSGVETIEKPSSNGVYIFRLNEKVQKIVVK